MVNVDTLEQPRFQQAWSVVKPGLLIKTEQDYKRAVALLDHLLDVVGEDEHHPLFSFLEVLGLLIERYEEEHVKIREATPVEVLRFLMDQHKLTQSDLPEVGSQGVVSEVLHGKRKLNTHQINAVSDRFGVSPAVFF